MSTGGRLRMVRTFGTLEGTCNICGKHARLTEDHTPPKGWIRPTQVELLHVVDHLGIGEKGRRRATRSQNGLKYRTLCASCNNGLLGAKYDPALIQFANDVAKGISPATIYSPVLTFTIQPQAVMRAVLGHMCAQGVDRYRKGPLTESMRDYLLDDSLPFPPGLNFHYWAYPFRHQTVVRDAVMTDFSGNEPIMFWLLKAFPLAFMVTWTSNARLPFHTHSLEPFRQSRFDLTGSVPLRVGPITPELWPEAPVDPWAVLYGEQAVRATGIER